MAWNYAELSKAAKAAGGPEKLIEALIDAGKSSGKKEMLPVVGIALAVGALATIGIQKLIKIFSKEKALPQSEIEAIKAELIQGIKDYDAAHEDIKEHTENVISSDENC